MKYCPPSLIVFMLTCHNSLWTLPLKYWREAAVLTIGTFRLAFTLLTPLMNYPWKPAPNTYSLLSSLDTASLTCIILPIFMSTGLVHLNLSLLKAYKSKRVHAIKHPSQSWDHQQHFHAAQVKAIKFPVPPEAGLYNVFSYIWFKKHSDKILILWEIKYNE